MDTIIIGFRVSRRPRGSTTEFAQESLFAHTAQRTKNDKERSEFYSTIFTSLKLNAVCRPGQRCRP